MIQPRLALAAALLFAPPAAPAHRGTPAAAPAQAAAAPWQADWGTYYCSLIRRPGPGRPFSTAFVRVPGMTGMHMTLVPEGSLRGPARVDNVALSPSGETFPITNESEDRGRLIMNRLFGLPYAFQDRLAAADELQLRDGDRVVARVPLDGVRTAVAAQRRCVASVAREWGLDEPALAALSRLPKSLNMLGLSAQDYPPQALRNSTQGRVVIRLSISTEGRPTDCVTVASSGSRPIDIAACNSALRRGRFEPALDAQGRPVAVRIINVVTFRMYSDGY